MSLELSKWDLAESIDSEEHARLLLEELLKDGTPAEIASVIDDIARAYGMAQLAKQTGLPVERFFTALNRVPGPNMVELLELAAALGANVDAKPHSNAAE
jgi:probable addiction module antidote protein